MQKCEEVKPLRACPRPQPLRAVELQWTRRLAWINLACDTYLRVIILELSQLNWHSLMNFLWHWLKSNECYEAEFEDQRLLQD